MVTRKTKTAPKVRRKVVLDEVLHGKGKKKRPALGADPFAKPPAAIAKPTGPTLAEQYGSVRSAPWAPAPASHSRLTPVHARLEKSIMVRIDRLAEKLQTKRGWGRITRSEALRHALMAGLDALEKAKPEAGV